jgi:hypothetical protein
LAGCDLSNRRLILQDVLTGVNYTRSGDDMANAGLFVDLPAWGRHFFKISDAAETDDGSTKKAGRMIYRR